MPTFLATFLTSRWILLVSYLIEYRSHSWRFNATPSCKGKPSGPCVCFPCLTYIPFLVGWQSLTCIWHRQPYNLITILKVSSASLDLFRWGHSYHTLTTPFFDYPSLATLELLLQTSYSSCSDSHSNVQDFMDYNKTLSGQTSAALLWFLIRF